MRYYIFKLPSNNPNWCEDVESEQIDLGDYVPVWTDEVGEGPSSDSEFLEELFMIFNVNHPEHYAAPSMSVGDIVLIRRNSGDVYYAVQGIGFKEVKLLEANWYDPCR